MKYHEIVVKDEQVNIAKDSLWRKLPAVFAMFGVGGLGASYALKGDDVEQFFYSYITAYMFFLSLSLGGLFFVLVQHATRAGWSIVVRRLSENVMITLPLMAVLLLPILVGVHDVFEWSHENVVANDAVLTAKQPYLNTGSFYIRAFVFIAIWSILSLAYHRWSTSQDRASDPIRFSDRMTWMAPLGLILFGLSLTFAAFDYMMSLDPHWFSTVFGVYYFAGCVLVIHATLVLLALALQRSGYLRGVVTSEHYHDLGKMMFAFTVFWAYIAFSQYMLIWYANVPEETYWYAYRGQGSWLWLSIALPIVRFAIPFFALISRWPKRNPKILAVWAVFILFGELLDMFWLIQPVLPHHHGTHELHVGLIDVTTLVGIGGLFLAVVCSATVGRPLVPLRDPRLDESLHHENA